MLIDVQNPAQVNRYLVSEADVFLIKEPSPLGQGFERPQLREYMDAARGAFSLMKKARRKRSVYVVAPGVGITGQIMETRLPTIWSKLLSTIFSSTRVGERLPSAAAALPELGDRRRVRRRRSNKSVAERREKARAMKKAGYSLGEIAVALGVSKSQAFRYCQDDDARSL